MSGASATRRPPPRARYVSSSLGCVLKHVIDHNPYRFFGKILYSLGKVIILRTEISPKSISFFNGCSPSTTGSFRTLEMALLDTLLSRKNFAELQRQWRAAACCGLPLSPWFRSPRGSRSARPVATALFRMSAYKATRRGRRAVPARRVLTLHANVHLVDNLGMVSMCKVGPWAAASGTAGCLAARRTRPRRL